LAIKPYQEFWWGQTIFKALQGKILFTEEFRLISEKGMREIETCH
jgi:hypothetical protein